MVQAGKHGLTNINYLWLVTQSVVGDPDEIRSTRNNLPTGMIGNIKYNNFPRNLKRNKPHYMKKFSQTRICTSPFFIPVVDALDYAG